jgi:hypothetical protein
MNPNDFLTSQNFETELGDDDKIIYIVKTTDNPQNPLIVYCFLKDSLDAYIESKGAVGGGGVPMVYKVKDYLLKSEPVYQHPMEGNTYFDKSLLVYYPTATALYAYETDRCAVGWSDQLINGGEDLPIYTLIPFTLDQGPSRILEMSLPHKLELAENLRSVNRDANENRVLTELLKDEIIPDYSERIRSDYRYMEDLGPYPALYPYVEVLTIKHVYNMDLSVFTSLTQLEAINCHDLTINNPILDEVELENCTVDSFTAPMLRDLRLENNAGVNVSAFSNLRKLIVLNNPAPGTIDVSSLQTLTVLSVLNCVLAKVKPPPTIISLRIENNLATTKLPILSQCARLITRNVPLLSEIGAVEHCEYMDCTGCLSLKEIPATRELVTLLIPDCPSLRLENYTLPTTVRRLHTTSRIRITHTLSLIKCVPLDATYYEPYARRIEYLEQYNIDRDRNEADDTEEAERNREEEAGENTDEEVDIVVPLRANEAPAPDRVDKFRQMREQVINRLPVRPEETVIRGDNNPEIVIPEGTRGVILNNCRSFEEVPFCSTMEVLQIVGCDSVRRINPANVALKHLIVTHCDRLVISPEIMNQLETLIIITEQELSIESVSLKNLVIKSTAIRTLNCPNLVVLVFFMCYFINGNSEIHSLSSLQELYIASSDVKSITGIDPDVMIGGDIWSCPDLKVVGEVHIEDLNDEQKADAIFAVYPILYH